MMTMARMANDSKRQYNYIESSLDKQQFVKIKNTFVFVIVAI